MTLTYGELYKKSLHLINDTSDGDNIGFELPIFQVNCYPDGQHFLQLFGITRDEPALKFGLYLNVKFRDYDPESNDNTDTKILDVMYIHRAFKPLKMDPEHQHFLQFLSSRFKKTAANLTMAEMTEFKYISLQNNLFTFNDFFTKRLELKLFHAKPYYEWYLNIDFPNKKVEFREKDEEYRGAIIDSLTHKAE